VFSYGAEDNRLTLEGTEGTWLDLGSLAPDPWRSHYNMDAAGQSWGFLQIGDLTYIARQSTSTYYISMNSPRSLQVAIEGNKVTDASANTGIIVGQRQGEPDLYAKQIVFLQTDFKTMIASLFLSTDGAGYNHATYDQLPQVGAGIPYELLGQPFLDSLDQVAASTVGGDLTVLMEKPTKLSEVVGADFLMRRSVLMFSEGTYSLVTPASPNEQIASTTVTEGTKGAPRLSNDDAQRTTTEVTSRYMRNVVKIEYNRSSDGKYRDSITIKNQDSINSHGESRPVTIKSRNSHGGSALGDTVTQIAGGVASYLVAVFGAPIRIYKRTINHNDFHLLPGDPILVTDNYVRDPTTGARGITSAPGVVMAIDTNWGGEDEDPTGGIEVMLEDFGRGKIFAPCADVDELQSNAGYDAGNKYLYVKANRFSDASDEDDDISAFSAGDEIRITEVDFLPGATPLSWIRTADAVSDGNERFTLDTTLTSPAWDATKRYRVMFANYSACQASQQSTYSFQADDADSRIEDAADPREWAFYKSLTTVTPSAWDGPTNQPEYMAGAEYYGDGNSMSPAHILNLAKFSNNGNSYKAAHQFPFLISHPTDGIEVEHGLRAILHVMPIAVTSYMLQQRQVTVAPIAKVEGPDDGFLYIVFSASPPKGAISSVLSTTQEETFSGEYVELEWNVTSTSFAVHAQQSVNLIRHWDRGLFYMTVLGSAAQETSDQSIYFKGLQYASIGPRLNLP